MKEHPQEIPELEAVEADLLVEGVRRWHGIELGDLSRSFLLERIREAMRREGLGSVSALQERVLHQPLALKRFLRSLDVVEAGPDPGLLAVFRLEIVPVLRTYPFIRIWQVGCTSPFDTYVLAIILLEEGVYGRSTIYSTDRDEMALGRSQDGLFPMSSLEGCEQVYRAAGGKGSLAQYCSRGEQMARFDDGLRRNVVFAQHDFATDGSFNEFNMIICRNSLRALDPALRAKALGTVAESLVVLGYLALCRCDSRAESVLGSRFQAVDTAHNLYRKAA